nr:protein PHYLLO, chloroplastic isoform X1 [Ipomoea batatas]
MFWVYVQVVRCSIREGRVLELEDAALIVSTCITRTLPPALTLEQGLEKIEEAVEELKANPPACAFGMLRFQVAVPPSPKSLNWFCCQPESSAVFPIIFLSKERDHPTYKSLALGRTHGVFGIGSAINFKGPSSITTGELSESGRYVSIDPKLIVAYGFFGIDSDKLLSFMKHEAGSDYFFVPQVLQYWLCNWHGMIHLCATLKRLFKHMMPLFSRYSFDPIFMCCIY